VHPAQSLFYRQVLKDNLLRQQPVAEVARTERYSVQVIVLYPFVEQQQFQFFLLEQSAGCGIVQPEVRHQKSERFAETETTPEYGSLVTERRIRNDYIPAFRLILEKILSGADMGMNHFKPMLFQC
jgi:hypothetical protein